MGFKDELRDRAQQYARQNGLALSDELGAGVVLLVRLDVLADGDAVVDRRRRGFRRGRCGLGLDGRRLET